MSEDARDERPEDAPRERAAEGSNGEPEDRPQVARQEGADRRPPSGRTTGGADRRPPSGRTTGGADRRPQELGDLIVEHWQAPKIDKMKGDGREIWQFESEKVRPSWTLWFNLFAVILALAGGLALIVYGIWRLASGIGPSGPGLP